MTIRIGLNKIGFGKLRPAPSSYSFLINEELQICDFKRLRVPFDE